MKLGTVLYDTMRCQKLRSTPGFLRTIPNEAKTNSSEPDMLFVNMGTYTLAMHTRTLLSHPSPLPSQLPHVLRSSLPLTVPWGARGQLAARCFEGSAGSPFSCGRNGSTTLVLPEMRCYPRLLLISRAPGARSRYM